LQTEGVEKLEEAFSKLLGILNAKRKQVAEVIV
jgi:hypothetical protein